MMRYETKRDVFEELLDAYDDVKSSDGNLHPTQELLDYDDRYAAAFLDDMPVIPKEVGEYIKSNRTEPLGKVFWHLGCISVALLGSTRSYIVDHSEIFARAWILGVWCVEETGEIVKLEEEK